MRINIPNNKRHFVVAEKVGGRCVVTIAATATWRNVDVLDVQLLAIWHRSCDLQDAAVILVAVTSPILAS